MAHKEMWDFYLSDVDDKPGSFYLDLGLSQVAPIEKMPFFFYVSIIMNRPRTDGLSSNDEYDKLIELEDHLVASVKRKHDVVYVGRLTSGGARDFYFYTDDTLLIEKTISESLVQFPMYQYDFEVKEDKDWSFYSDFIYPNPRQLQCILNRSVVENLEKNGDRLHKSREVCHWIYFKSPDDREHYIAKTTEKGFKTDQTDINEQYDKEYKYSLKISRVDSVGYRDVDEYVLYLWELAAELGGQYDGWETSVEID
jgi:uncharacterized protein (TIGR01619 family)